MDQAMTTMWKSMGQKENYRNNFAMQISITKEELYIVPFQVVSTLGNIDVWNGDMTKKMMDPQ